MEITRTFDLLDYLVTKFPDKTDIFAAKEKGEWVIPTIWPTAS